MMMKQRVKVCNLFLFTGRKHYSRTKPIRISLVPILHISRYSRLTIHASSADTEQDIEQLIDKTEQEGEQVEAVKDQFSFSFAKVWAADKDSLEDVADDTPDVDSWAQTLKRIAAEQRQHKGQEVTGRGTRRRAAAAPLFPQVCTTPAMPQNSVLDYRDVLSATAITESGRHNRTESAETKCDIKVVCFRRLFVFGCFRS
jgi:hypothetical protein